jgi:osmotically-inducible protein OsmY
MTLMKLSSPQASPVTLRALPPAAALLVWTLWTFPAAAAPTGPAQDASPPQTQPDAPAVPAPADSGPATVAPVPLPTDDEIQARVEESLTHDAAIADHGTFRVKCEEGIVTLGGKADTLSILMQAERIAGDVRGVLDVVVQVALPTSGIADSQILLEIQSSLRMPTFRGDHIAVAVMGGEVHLNGTTVTYSHKLLAERAAAEVPGVVSVQNNLRVVAPPEGDDTELVRRIHLLLTAGLTPVPGIFEVTVKKGEAILSGKVPLYSNRIQAERLAYSVGGIRTVENRLKVDPSLFLPPPTVEVTP